MKTPHGWVYIVRSYNLYKIGSAGDLDRRLMQLRTAAPFLEEVYSIPCWAHKDVEKHLHALFSDKREAGEWFALDDSDLLSIIEMEWEEFPAEKKARASYVRVYNEVVKTLNANPELYAAVKATTPGDLELITSNLKARVNA